MGERYTTQRYRTIVVMMYVMYKRFKTYGQKGLLTPSSTYTCES